MIDDLEDLARRQARAQNGLDPTHTRPAPWFVGSGRRLMLLIVSLIAVLIVLRGVTTVWLVEDAWHWWTNQAVSPPSHSTARVQTRAAPPALTMPANARAAAGSAAEWITSDDYPAEAIRREQEGVSLIRWRIDADGLVRQCGTVRSSGYPALDAAACAAIVRRANYRPALDAAGRPIASTQQRRVRWVLPK